MIDILTTSQQRDLRESVRRLVADGISKHDGPQFPAVTPQMWRALGEGLGVLGLGVDDEVDGGAGLPGGGIVELTMVGAAFAEVGLDTPFIDTAFATGIFAALGGDDLAPELESTIRGDAVWLLAASEPGRRYALNAANTRMRPEGQGLLLSGAKLATGTPLPVSGYLVTAELPVADDGVRNVLIRVPADTPGLTVRAVPTYDGRTMTELELRDVAVSDAMILSDTPAGWQTVERLHDIAIVVHSGQAVALMRRLLRDTVAYCKQRTQFGVPIGSFQALQHRMVDMHMQIEQADAAVQQAQLASLSEDAEIAAQARGAKVVTARASRFVGENAVQLHGGMGMMDELSISHGFKRLVAMASEYGTAEEHLNEYVEVTQA